MFYRILFMFSLICSSVFAQTGDVIGVHDPSIIKEGDTYYIFSTGGLINVRKSKDLQKWESLPDALLPNLPKWTKQYADADNDAWAPDVTYFNGQFHLYYTVSTIGTNKSCIGLATNVTLDSSSPKYKWKDQGVVVFSKPTDDFNAIDPNVFIDEKKQPWLTFGSFWKGILLTRLDLKSGKPFGQPIHIASRGGGAIEAPFITKHGGLYYLFVSFDQCCKGTDSTYKVVVGRSQRIEGPYFDWNGKKMLEGGGTLVLAGHNNIRGPGHNSLLSDNGKEYLVHHFYDAQSGGQPTLQIRPMAWPKNGWPLVGEPDLEKPSVKDPDLTGRWNHTVDFKDDMPIIFHSNGKINREDGKIQWKLTGNALELRWPRSDNKGMWIDECLVGPSGDWYVGRNQQGLLIRGTRLE